MSFESLISGLFSGLSELLGPKKPNSYHEMSAEERQVFDDVKAAFLRMNGIGNELAEEIALIEQRGLQNALLIYQDYVAKGKPHNNKIRELVKLTEPVGYLTEANLRLYLLPSFPDAEKRIDELLKDSKLGMTIAQQVSNLPRVRRQRNNLQGQGIGVDYVSMILKYLWRDGPAYLRDNALDLQNSISDSAQSYSDQLRQRVAVKAVSGMKANKRSRRGRAGAHVALREVLSCERQGSFQDSGFDVEQYIADMQADMERLIESLPPMLKTIEELEQELKEGELKRQENQELYDVALHEARRAYNHKRDLLAQLCRSSRSIDSPPESGKEVTLLEGDQSDEMQSKVFQTLQRVHPPRYETDRGDGDLKGISPDQLDFVKNIRDQLTEKRIQVQLEEEKIRVLRNSITRVQNETARYEKKIAMLSDLSGEQASEICQLQYELDHHSDLSDTVSESKYPPLGNLEKWSHTHLMGRVIILKSAFKSAANSNYQKPDLVYQALELLAGPYWDQKTAGNSQAASDLRRSFKQSLDGLYLDIGKTSAVTLHPNDRRRYFVQYNGKEYYMDQHLGRGSVRDPAWCFRLYFTWLENEKKILVGHLPDHLPNTLS